jgi:hypothetical protein
MAFDLWEPDTLINDHFARRLRSPEKRLLMAVLMDAVAEFQEVVGSSAKEDEPRRRKLTAWFRAQRDSWPCSFENLCELLDLDPGSVRARLATLVNERPVRPRWRRAHQANRSIGAIG